MPELFARIILPLSLHNSYTYKVPEEFQEQIKPGQRVIVQFGKKRFYAGLVITVSNDNPEKTELKLIQQILDEQPVVLPKNVELWKWIADYYCCTLGDVFRAALPSGLKLESRSKVFLTGNDEEKITSDKEYLIIQKIGKNTISLNELQKNLGHNFSYSALKSLIDKNILQIEERISSKYKPKTETFVRLDKEIKNEEHLNPAIENLNRAKKQKALLLHFCEKTNLFEQGHISEISKKDLLKGTSFSANLLKELEKKKLLIQL